MNVKSPTAAACLQCRLSSTEASPNAASALYLHVPRVATTLCHTKLRQPCQALGKVQWCADPLLTSPRSPVPKDMFSLSFTFGYDNALSPCPARGASNPCNMPGSTINPSLHRFHCSTGDRHQFYL
jgi:hypothetical protein